MPTLAAVAGTLLVLAVLWDAFEVIILPRRVVGRLRLARWFYRLTWATWAAAGRRMRPGGRREAYLSVYGPLSLLVLIMLWAVTMVFGFGLIQWAARGPAGEHGPATLGSAVYLSGTTFFTLGLGDVVPTQRAARILTVIEGGTGFLFLAVLVGYLPVMYQAFSRREVSISMLDARAGSPPSAGELLSRHRRDLGALYELLHDWERWSAELLESHLSYNVLSYFRSQHDNESWLAALTTILDACALMLTAGDTRCRRQAGLTFAMARHAVADLAQVLAAMPRPPARDRLPPPALAELRTTLRDDGIVLESGEAADRRVAELRGLYEPFLNGLAEHLVIALPPFRRAQAAADNWQTTAWNPSPPAPPVSL
ncbi:MAG TPA: potassium channel family protein [Methylomirabilota bacterium]|nr:potassium channel family protein [Methylomirabilota bacterium]